MNNVITETQADYSLQLTLLVNQWENISLSLFNWTGLQDANPDIHFDGRTIEKKLFEHGQVAFFKDGENGFLCLPCAAESFNVENEPVTYLITGNGYTAHKNAADVVIIRNNSLAKGDIDYVTYYCKKIINIEQLKTVRLNQHKLPLVIETSDTMELSAKQLIRKITGNEPYIVKNGFKTGENGINIKPNNTEPPYINDRLNDEKNEIINTLKEYLGLDASPIDKKERVQAAEVNQNNEYVIANFKTRLDNRQKAAEEINKKFGLNIKINYVENDEITNEQKGEEQNNDAVHSNN